MVKTFWNRLNQTLNNGDRIQISTSQSMAAYNTTLQITPVNISDTGMYQCVGSISSNRSYVFGASNALASISLNVQGEDKHETSPLILSPSLSSPALPPPVVTTSSYGSTIAGSVYSLVCMVKVVDGLVVVPDVVWMMDGAILVNGINTTLTRTVSGGNSTLNLTFIPLFTSHGGQYTCVATISVPQLSLSVTNSSAVTVSVQSELNVVVMYNLHYIIFTVPAPNATISLIPSSQSVYLGTPINVSCAFSVLSVVDTPIVFKTFWIGPQGPIYNGNRTMITTIQSIIVYTTILQISPLNTSDSGLYSCMGNISSNSSYIITPINALANITLDVQGEIIEDQAHWCYTVPTHHQVSLFLWSLHHHIAAQ